MKRSFVPSSDLIFTGLWMAATRFGPLAAGLIAALSLPTREYGQYVVAFAWAGGIVSVLASTSQALAARALHNVHGPAIDRNSQVMRDGTILSLFAALSVIPIFRLMDQSWYLIAALVLAVLFGSLNASFAAQFWGMKRYVYLAIVSLCESLLMIAGVRLGSLWFQNAQAAIGGLALGSFAALFIYVVVLRLWRRETPEPQTIVMPTVRLKGLLGPNLINGIAGALGPALGISLAASREPQSAALYGVYMLIIAACLFPVQILGIALAPGLIKQEFGPRVALALKGLGFTVLWSLFIGAGLFVFGDLILGILVPEFVTSYKSYQGSGVQIASVTLVSLALIAIIGPIVQAEHFYWRWAWVNILGATMFGASAFFAPISLELALTACLLSACIRLVFAVPMCWSIVMRWRAQI